MDLDIDNLKLQEDEVSEVKNIYYKDLYTVFFTYQNNKVYYQDYIYKDYILLNTSKYIHPIILYYILL